MAGKRRGLYVSYNEDKGGSFSDAVAISNTIGCVTWIDGFPLDPVNLECPTGLIVRIKGKDRYYRGVLLAVARMVDLPKDFAEEEGNHRPVRWQHLDREELGKSVLFIHGLREVPMPPEVEGRRPPQHPEHVEVVFEF